MAYATITSSLSRPPPPNWTKSSEKSIFLSARSSFSRWCVFVRPAGMESVLTRTIHGIGYCSFGKSPDTLIDWTKSTNSTTNDIEFDRLYDQMLFAGLGFLCECVTDSKPIRFNPNIKLDDKVKTIQNTERLIRMTRLYCSWKSLNFWWTDGYVILAGDRLRYILFVFPVNNN